MPIGAMATAGNQVFTLVRKLREELGVNTTCGASNISFGLPNRHGINNAFLPMAMGAGMTSAIMNPVALPVSTKKIEEKKEEIQKAGIVLPVDLDQETFVKIFGLGSTKSSAGKEMEAIRAANLLTDNDLMAPLGYNLTNLHLQAVKSPVAAEDVADVGELHSRKLKIIFT